VGVLAVSEQEAIERGAVRGYKAAAALRPTVTRKEIRMRARASVSKQRMQAKASKTSQTREKTSKK
jgi:hypothetical protein